jgi:stearoyl-CoA desaturase (delta-9 desaturase)
VAGPATGHSSKPTARKAGGPARSPARRAPFWWLTPVGFLGLHLAAAVTVFLVPVTWSGVALALGFYWLRLFGITAGLHRLFSHRGFKTSRWFQFVLGWLGASAVQGGPLWWAAHHRQHHKHSDQDGDPHSPITKSVWHAHVGWVLTPEVRNSDMTLVKDWTKYPELVWLDRLELVPAVVQAAVCYLVAGWSGVVWGFLVSTVVLYHATFLVNSVCHLMGKRRFETDDRSRNNWWVALIVFGEGWHNNHHHYPSAARQGFKWWELDVTYYILKALSWVGVVWDLREPTPRALARATKRTAPAGE